MRMPNDTPARISMYEALQPSTKKRGKTPTTWLKVIEKDLTNIIHLDIHKNNADTTIAHLTRVTVDTNKWLKIIKNIMKSNF